VKDIYQPIFSPISNTNNYREDSRETKMKDTGLIVDKIVETYEDGKGINFSEVKNLPQRDEILYCLDLIKEVLFPGYTGRYKITRENVSYVIGGLICEIRERLYRQVQLAMMYECSQKHNVECRKCIEDSRIITDKLIESLPQMREMLKTDIQAAYDGDPAAYSFEEIVVSYPGLIAISTHRIAHELYNNNVPMIPRIMSENAHQITGIDIHPGAKIGKHFFIDHGTGVVIGETAVIGNNVKIYQGVTLGAISFPKDERGNIIKGQKRHPTISDNVTIYAEATILGDIVVGEGVVVAGNTWVKEAVEAGQTVMYANPELVVKPAKKKIK
jgi:serine O-acetyltransferase